MTHDPLWISRPLLNAEEVAAWALEAGIRKIMPFDQLKVTLATVRDAVDWSGLVARDDEIVVTAGPKPVRIFGRTIKAISFEDPRLTARQAELLRRYPTMDHARFRAHVSLYKGGRMPQSVYEGRLVFGPERIMRFDAANVGGVKHVKVSDLVAATT